ncbi:undecaprenyl-diphosphate phosphatase [Clostridiaceae bacterium UIB06]|uniref:Undecaprenyl-diphosphatase n=1 Tax=Clostridium thailandense TaxID=2794346 RepID=A0A949TMA5_9CLOT|nr:undecaprenyl-diphosphate phosphatase [Clostridium thailandense]MBV7274980.1 undecaprenyl-diphosphate phosphatase [Clostridium thailandense]MCH5137899.1 undecaprenyl-diphosphate phosphatase [Clostridiaceae bacterium UIB06]
MDFVLIFKAVIIGIVEGITEFLPISSTGHMIIVENLIKFKAPMYPKAYIDMFDIVIQLGAILAIVVLYREKIKDSLRNLSPGESGFRLWLNMLVAFIPSAVIGLLLHKTIEEKLFNAVTVAFALVVGGILMIVMENKYRRGNPIRSIDNVNIVQAFKIGCFQCLSLWPGMSRSASTIMGAWVSGLNTVAAAEFSFFLAIPTMVAASGYSLLKLKISMSSAQIVALIVAFVVSFIVALVVVEGFVNFLKRKPMRIFAIYRILIGIIILVLAFTKGMAA